MTFSSSPGHAARRFIGMLGLACAALLALGASAQADYPNRPVKIIVPFSAGGMSDGLTRMFAKELQERLGQPFVLDFRPGAATNIGAAAVASAAPDGYTLFVSTMASHALNKWSYRSLSYDPDTMANVGMIGVLTSFLVVRPDSPFKTVDDLVRAAKTNPNGLSYGTHGAGGPNPLIAELLRSRAGIKTMVHVPYRGLPQSSVDLIGGRIDFMIDGASINLVESGRLRALAVTYPKRWPTQPSIPTMGEAGFPDVTMTAFFGIAAPANTPPAILNKLNEVLRTIGVNPEIEKRMLAMNVMPMPVGRVETTDFIRVQSEKWRPVLKDLNITFD
jgi:tripartite-type tricarboxylate transporter receptor subunit TctC